MLMWQPRTVRLHVGSHDQIHAVESALRFPSRLPLARPATIPRKRGIPRSRRSCSLCCRIGARGQRAIGRSIERYGLEGGCVVNGAREKLRDPLWALSGPDTRANLTSDLAVAIEAARHIHARHIIVLSGALPNVPVALQFAAMVRALKTRGYKGLVELEHGWSEPTRAREQRGIDNLQRMDSQDGKA